MPSSWMTWAKCSVACPKYTIRPEPSSKGRALTPGVISRKSLQLPRAWIGRSRWKSPSMVRILPGRAISSIGVSAVTVMVSSSSLMDITTSTPMFVLARTTTPSCR